MLDDDRVQRSDGRGISVIKNVFSSVLKFLMDYKFLMEAGSF